MRAEERRAHLQEGLGTLPVRGGKGAVEVMWPLHLQEVYLYPNDWAASSVVRTALAEAGLWLSHRTATRVTPGTASLSNSSRLVLKSAF